MTNWWYMTVGIVRRWMPSQILFALMQLRGGANGAESDPASNAMHLQAHLDAVGLDIHGKTVIELGSGRTARSGLQLLAAGAANVTLIDLYAMALDDQAHRALLEQDCVRLGLNFADALARLRVVQGDFMNLRSLDMCVDLVLSVAVLEHVHDPGTILKHCYDCLAPGGATLHIVDLRDHNLSFRYPFEMLTYSESVWERWFNLQEGFHLNRWRAPDYRLAMEATGLINTRCITTQRDDSGAQAIRSSLAPRFQSLSNDDLAILGIALYGERAI